MFSGLHLFGATFAYFTDLLKTTKKVEVTIVANDIPIQSKQPTITIVFYRSAICYLLSQNNTIHKIPNNN